MKKFCKYLPVFLLFIFILGASEPKKNREAIFQASTINALLEGSLDGTMPLKRLIKHGDFGIGTFDALDGEMVVLDGICYQVKPDGTVVAAVETQKTPFATVTFFDVDETIALNQEMNLAELGKFIDEKIKTKNIFYAIKIDGEFKYMKTRSPFKQTKPYPALKAVSQMQSVFEFTDVKGTAVGFRVPEYANGFNMPGYHFHFLDSARKAGGHILELKTSNVKIELDYTHKFSVDLPQTEEFYKIDLSKDKKDELNKAEK